MAATIPTRSRRGASRFHHVNSDCAVPDQGDDCDAVKPQPEPRKFADLIEHGIDRGQGLPDQLAKSARRWRLFPKADLTGKLSALHGIGVGERIGPRLSRETQRPIGRDVKREI